MNVSARTQRWLVFVASALLLVVLVDAGVSGGERAEANHGSVVQCGANNANRASLRRRDGVFIDPCVSGANLRLFIDGPGGGLFNAPSSAHYRVYKVSIADTTVPIKYANGLSEPVYHLTFESFTINKNATMTVGPLGITGAPAVPYNLTLKPALNATIGGQGINTDLWVTGSSRMAVSLTTISCIEATVSTFTGLDWLVTNSNLFGCSMDMQVRYMTTYVPGGATLDKFPLNLPNMLVSVG